MARSGTPYANGSRKRSTLNRRRSSENTTRNERICSVSRPVSDGRLISALLEDRLPERLAGVPDQLRREDEPPEQQREADEHQPRAGLAVRQPRDPRRADRDATP